jgi:undecaprenyl-diphosphatase
MQNLLSSPLIHALILGVVQGLTEFLPVSSSGHLALAQALIPGFNQPGIFLDVMLHVGTLAAVVIYFRAELIGLVRSLPRLARGGVEPAERRLWLGVLVASVPTGIMGVLLQDRVEAMIGSVPLIGAALIVTGLWLLAGEALAEKAMPRLGPPGLGRALLIGIAQGIAVTPGISRSGSTISAARALGISGPEAARFSFLLSLPAVFAAGIFELYKERHALLNTPEHIHDLVIATVVAFIIGYASIAFLLGYLKKHTTWLFIIYRLAMGAVLLTLLWSGRLAAM